MTQIALSGLQGTYWPTDSSTNPRFAGPVSFFRLPTLDDPAKADIALLGVPWDGGTTNRAGARHGPRDVRIMSTLIRPFHHVTRTSPYDECRVADFGDASVNPLDIADTLARVEAVCRDISEAGAVPLAAGGDHLSSLPILRAIAKDGPVGLIQFDAHSDTNDTYFGGHRYSHGTHVRRAIEEGLVDPKRTVQIGIRGTRYRADGPDFNEANGIRVIYIEEVFDIGVEAVVNAIRRVVGTGPTYLTFDVDGIDPAFAPGTGTPEVGGYSVFQAQQMVRGLRGLNLIGADVVEVSPPFDSSGNTALVGATMMFEILCVLAEATARRKRKVAGNSPA
ncbi:MAG: agmatinase [Paracoccaceae bacterium]|nr:agmatinase [Paracoccaceae bacterium]